MQMLLPSSVVAACSLRVRAGVYTVLPEACVLSQERSIVPDAEGVGTCVLSQERSIVPDAEGVGMM